MVAWMDFSRRAQRSNAPSRVDTGPSTAACNDEIFFQYLKVKYVQCLRKKSVFNVQKAQFVEVINFTYFPRPFSGT